MDPGWGTREREREFAANYSSSPREDKECFDIYLSLCMKALENEWNAAGTGSFPARSKV
jgi:hypothetical protein